MRNYKLFFENLKLIQKKYEILKLNDDDFNIFSILRNEGDEVNLHSKFITELLSNKKYGKVFLKLFLEVNELDIENIIEYNATQEYYAGKMGRIDIVLEIETPSGKKIIAIENKIYAGDQNKQLERYFNCLKTKVNSKENVYIVYLTLDGTIPSKDSLGKLKEEDIYNKSYKNEIILWIEHCIKEVALNPNMREVLVQYKNLLEKLTNRGEENMVNELKEFILSDEKYLSTAFLIPDILLDIKSDLQYSFWKSLEKGMEELKEKYNFKLINNFDSINKSYSYENIKKYYRNSTNKKFYGLMYELKELEFGEKLYLRIEIESSIYWGFRVIDKDNNSNKNLNRKYIDQDLKELMFESTDYWLGLKYFYLNTNKLETINFNAFNENLYKLLLDENALEELVKFNIEKIREDLEILKNNKNIDMIPIKVSHILSTK